MNSGNGLTTVPAAREDAARPADRAVMRPSAGATQRLRVGLLAHGFPVYSETFVTTLAAELLEAGQDLRILATDPSPPSDPTMALAGHDRLAPLVARARSHGKLQKARLAEFVRRVPRRAPLLAGLALADRLAPRRLAVTRLFAGEAPFDVVHAQFGFLGLTAMRHRHWGTLRTRALVVHLRGYDITHYVEKRGRHVYRRLFREADLFIANCAFFRDHAVQLGCPPEKIVVIGSPIDIGRFAPPPSRAPAGGRQVRLVAVGRLVEKKGFADAVEAVAQLVARGRDVRLEILGEGECRADLETRIARAGLGDRVTLHGVASQAQVIAALHAADIALAPSVTASTGDADAAVNTAKEAMATGLPVIATRHGGIPELVIPGENGDLVPERDPAALASSIAKMMDEPQSWEALGRAGRMKVVTEYDHRHILERTLDAYRLALTRAGEPHA